MNFQNTDCSIYFSVTIYDESVGRICGSQCPSGGKSLSFPYLWEEYDGKLIKPISFSFFDY